jgi:hypothetical protein
MFFPTMHECALSTFSGAPGEKPDGMNPYYVSEEEAAHVW